ncbi:MAG: transketolase [Coriobacteriia bacterium]|nr:transketolase [Coriobacteriia bacterium]
MWDRATVEAKASRMRGDIVEMIGAAGSGHPGGSLSAADIVATLYFGGVLRHDPTRPEWPERDRFILSKGHAGPVLYAALAEAGYFGRDHLSTLRKLGSMLQGHPDSRKTPGVEVSTGSLGQGLSIASGLAAGLRGGEHPQNVTDDRTVFCLLGDGEIQEGQVWEAAMFAAHERLGNLVAIIDHNGLQIDGACSEVMCLGTVANKFAAFDWAVTEVDGHDVEQLHAALEAGRAHSDGPFAIIAHTVKGKGVSFMEGDAGWHGKAPSPEQVAAALAELGLSEGSAS